MLLKSPETGLWGPSSCRRKRRGRWASERLLWLSFSQIKSRRNVRLEVWSGSSSAYGLQAAAFELGHMCGCSPVKSQEASPVGRLGAPRRPQASVRWKPLSQASSRPDQDFNGSRQSQLLLITFLSRIQSARGNDTIRAVDLTLLATSREKLECGEGGKSSTPAKLCRHNQNRGYKDARR